jgi:hypothetical protein
MKDTQEAMELAGHINRMWAPQIMAAHAEPHRKSWRVTVRLHPDTARERRASVYRVLEWWPLEAAWKELL